MALAAANIACEIESLSGDTHLVFVAALVAGFEMARDGSFELQSAVAQYAREQLKLLASKH